MPMGLTRIGLHGKKIAGVIEWSEEGHAETTVGHGVEHAMRGRDEREMRDEHPPYSRPCLLVLKPNPDDDDTQYDCKA
jgi:hypothetical protein